MPPPLPPPRTKVHKIGITRYTGHMRYQEIISRLPASNQENSPSTPPGMKQHVQTVHLGEAIHGSESLLVRRPPAALIQHPR